MTEVNRLREQKRKPVELFFYLIPVFGIFPALWTLYHRHGVSREQKNVSRLSVTLTLAWIIVYISLWFGATQTSELMGIRLLYLNGLFTSGYFLVCVGLLIRLWQGKSLRRLGISKIAEKLEKHLS